MNKCSNKTQTILNLFIMLKQLHGLREEFRTLTQGIEHLREQYEGAIQERTAVVARRMNKMIFTMTACTVIISCPHSCSPYVATNILRMCACVCVCARVCSIRQSQ